MRADVDARLPRTRDCAAIARRLIEKHVGADAGCQALDDLTLVVTALVERRLPPRARRDPSQARRARQSRARGGDRPGRGRAARITEQGPDEVGGFGLSLVEQVSAAWGAYEGTTHVWAELSLR
jgi:hypothetical protein